MSHDEIVYDVVMGFLSLSIICFAVLVIFMLWKAKEKEKEKQINEDDEEAPSSLSTKLCASSFLLMDIDAATDGFNSRRIIGSGRLGTVYIAVMPRGELIAVKRIHPRLVLSHAGLGFSPMLKWLSLAQHPHVVPILGFSEGPGERIMMMEYLGMMSLDFYLHQNYDGASLLDWGRRLRIAAGAARGLEYLHEMVAPPIVHGCMKPSNILIDVKFCAKVCDYGLSFLAPLQEREGLVGYVDEEYWVGREKGGGGACKESDVYGLGVVLLELLSGRKSEGGLIVKWGLPLIKEMRMSELLDPRLVIPCEIKPLVRLAKVASACIGNARENRPSISQIVTILNNLEHGALLMSNGSLL